MVERTLLTHGAEADDVDPATFRHVLGHFCTGVTIVTGLDDSGSPSGLACQSFTSLSLDPPLVLICPGRSSTSWPRIESTGRFTVNVLAEDQQDVSMAFGSRTAAKFDAVPWHVTDRGAVVLDNVLAWVHCDIEATYDGGDHQIIVGAVRRMRILRDHGPLLFFRGGYGLPTQKSASTISTVGDR
ncbi:flavin reductase family protein [Frankia sp. CNm7]|uniref:Flavin reductase family protein n=1 Tax=Frankia nepalensis TaxID=1836974 RepID=A0A937USJ3_9ACTN|nr:flavin reductase family protein [Frankia nepalensis]MBL7495248.1 flavin reductase family protein [Frankia nepalensis]MBL7511579.1 flavin reductase family protein [Frankia nepalensis]MBL7518938.1 flavin reductase family protein [Frankia nepalensis]MBL7628951.1 flavin reductase family protein [Frankia nepalensis]